MGLLKYAVNKISMLYESERQTLKYLEYYQAYSSRQVLDVPHFSMNADMPHCFIKINTNDEIQTEQQSENKTTPKNKAASLFH